MSNDNNVHDWLPTTYDETQDFSWFQKHFDNETFVLISWEGCTLEDHRLELFAKKLLPPASAQGTSTLGPLPKPEPPQWARRSVLRPIGSSARPRRSRPPRPAVSKTSRPASGFRPADQPRRSTCPKRTPWTRLRGLFVGPDDKQTCAVVTLTEEGKRDLRSHAGNELQRITTERARPAARAGPAWADPPVDNVAISVEGEKTLIRLFIPAGIVGLSLAFWCLRSVRLTIMVFGAALYAGAISLAIVHYSRRRR